MKLAFPLPIIKARGFCNKLIPDDTLHVAWRGFVPEFLASASVDVLGTGDALLRPHELDKLWAKRCGLELSTVACILSEDAYLYLNAKSWDLKLLRSWLCR